VASIPEYGKPLSVREVDVLSAFCGSNHTAKGVARELGISHRTVEVHMINAMVKLGAKNKLHALLMWDREQRAAFVAGLDCAHRCGVGAEVAEKLRTFGQKAPRLAAPKAGRKDCCGGEFDCYAREECAARGAYGVTRSDDEIKEQQK
jgi:DNA-binding CsgD family transcriptional regulator